VTSYANPVKPLSCRPAARSSARPRLNPRPRRMEQHPLAVRLAELESEARRNPRRPASSARRWVPRSLAGPVGGHHDGTKAPTRKAGLVEPAKRSAAARRRPTRNPGPLSECQLRLLCAGGCDRRQQHGVSGAPDHALISHFSSLYTSLVRLRSAPIGVPSGPGSECTVRERLPCLELERAENAMTRAGNVPVGRPTDVALDTALVAGLNWIPVFSALNCGWSERVVRSELESSGRAFRCPAECSWSSSGRSSSHADIESSGAAALVTYSAARQASCPGR